MAFLASLLFVLFSSCAALPTYKSKVFRDDYFSKKLNSTVGPLDPRRILCPVLAAMVNAGDLHPDHEGDVTLEDIYQALNDKIWDDATNADIQATGIAVYDLDNKETEKVRDRCITGSPCWAYKKIHGLTNFTERWLGIYRMNGRMMAEHGMSTGVRGGATNVPEFDHTGGNCNGEYPCESRFQMFYAECADSNGNFYEANIYCILCRAWQFGDRGGEWSYNPGQTGQQWQAIAAMTGWLKAFGRPFGGAYDPKTTHFTMADVRAMMMEGRYPDGWEKRHWGSAKDFPDAMRLRLPCADKAGYLPPWWQLTQCQPFSGATCTPFKKCGGGASCLTGYWTGKCVCGRGSNNIAMCWDATTLRCEERESTCTYFGEPCQVYDANNPNAPY